MGQQQGAWKHHSPAPPYTEEEMSGRKPQVQNH
jgi:hypothetical protein